MKNIIKKTYATAVGIVTYGKDPAGITNRDLKIVDNVADILYQDAALLGSPLYSQEQKDIFYEGIANAYFEKKETSGVKKPLSIEVYNQSTEA